MNKKRTLVYVVLPIAILFSVTLKQQTVTRERTRKVASTISEWVEKGKPVEVWKAVRRDVPVYTKVSARQINAHVFQGYVSREVRDKVAVGQDMLFRADGKDFTGRITTIAEDISLETGMYPVQTTFPQAFDFKNWVTAYAHTDTLRQVLCVPNEIIDKENDAFFIWKVVDGKAARQDIAIQQRDGYGAVVSGGLNEGDLVIVKGAALLAEGDKVNVLKELSGAGGDAADPAVTGAEP